MMMEDIKTPRTSSSLRPERTSDDSMGSWASSIHSAADEIQQHYQAHRGDESQCRAKFAQMVQTAYNYHHQCKEDDAGRMELVFDDSNCVCLIRTTTLHGASEYWKFGGDDENLQYLPPEAATHGRHNRKLADIWILGISLYRLLIGKYPFSGAPDHRKLFVKMLHGDFRMPSHLSEDAKDLLRRMLAPDAARASLDLVIFHPWLRSCTIFPPPSPPSSPLPSPAPHLADIKSKSKLTSPEKREPRTTSKTGPPLAKLVLPSKKPRTKSTSKKKRKMLAAVFKRTLLVIAYGPFPPPKQPYRALASLGRVHAASSSAFT
ncbi:kinase-like domain-containing protein [Syncephalastrum racemosum]|uniref:Kinase-like domain-containing protein n=1 Tax=Syncephalastrum racemosum TaxID=13706 RepID=A0A1X2HNY4_SYNRA|nr:kinase-like domain-containing protein [Syncephalastrum racemosum]